MCAIVAVEVTAMTIFVFSNVVLDFDSDFLSVFEETASVAEWFTLGLYMKVPPSELERINADFRFSKRALRETLSIWLKTGNATWSTLVHALSKIGLRSLGRNISTRKGW